MRDRQFLADLYDHHAARLYAIALRVAGDRDAAADALEAAFVALCRNEEVRDAVTYLVQATRDAALARQSQRALAAVVPKEATPKRMVEEAWYDGMSVRDLAARYSISEDSARGMLCDGMVQLRTEFVARTR